MPEVAELGDDATGDDARKDKLALGVPPNDPCRVSCDPSLRDRMCVLTDLRNGTASLDRFGSIFGVIVRVALDWFRCSSLF